MSLTPEFKSTLTTWLKATKGEHKFSRKLANFVTFRQACRVLKFTPKADAPDFCRRDADVHRPADRLRLDQIYLTDREDDALWVPNGRNTTLLLMATSLSSALSDGGSCNIHSNWIGKEYYDVEDISLMFWERYMQIGKCLFDWEHTSYGTFRYGAGSPAQDNNRFTMLDDQTAKCRWCGDVMHLHRTVNVEIETSSHWEHVPPSFQGKTFRCRRCHRPKPIADFHQSLTGYAPKKCTKGSRWEKVKIEDKGICPACLIAEVMADPVRRRLLLPTSLRTPFKAE